MNETKNESIFNQSIVDGVYPSLYHGLNDWQLRSSTEEIWRHYHERFENRRLLSKETYPFLDIPKLILDIDIENLTIKYKKIFPSEEAWIISPEKQLLNESGVQCDKADYLCTFGPVKLLSWCPNVSNKKQILSVLVSKNVDNVKLDLNPSQNNDDLIQIWDMGFINDKNLEPKLLHAFQHEWGNIISMQWISPDEPSVKLILEVIRTTNDSWKPQPLYGHMLFCCSDGYIRICPIPKFSKDQFKKAEKRFMKFDPNFILKLGLGHDYLNDSRSFFGYPTCSAWNSVFPGWCIAGYSSGHIGFFDLTCVNLFHYDSTHHYLISIHKRRLSHYPITSTAISPSDWQIVNYTVESDDRNEYSFTYKFTERTPPVVFENTETKLKSCIWPSRADVLVSIPVTNDCIHLTSIISKKMLSISINDITNVISFDSSNSLLVSTEIGAIILVSLNNQSFIQYLMTSDTDTDDVDVRLNIHNYRLLTSKDSKGNKVKNLSGCKLEKDVIKFYDTALSVTFPKINAIDVNPNVGTTNLVAVGFDCGFIHFLKISEKKLFKCDNKNKLSHTVISNTLENSIEYSKEGSKEPLLNMFVDIMGENESKEFKDHVNIIENSDSTSIIFRSRTNVSLNSESTNITTLNNICPLVPYCSDDESDDKEVGVDDINILDIVNQKNDVPVNNDELLVPGQASTLEYSEVINDLDIEDGTALKVVTESREVICGKNSPATETSNEVEHEYINKGINERKSNVDVNLIHKTSNIFVDPASLNRNDIKDYIEEKEKEEEKVVDIALLSEKSVLESKNEEIEWVKDVLDNVSEECLIVKKDFSAKVAETKNDIIQTNFMNEIRKYKIIEAINFIEKEDGDKKEGGGTNEYVDKGEGRDKEEDGDMKEDGYKEEYEDMKEDGDKEEGGDTNEGGDMNEDVDKGEYRDKEEYVYKEEGGDTKEDVDKKKNGDSKEVIVDYVEKRMIDHIRIIVDDSDLDVEYSNDFEEDTDLSYYDDNGKVDEGNYVHEVCQEDLTMNTNEAIDTTVITSLKYNTFINENNFIHSENIKSLKNELESVSEMKNMFALKEDIDIVEYCGNKDENKITKTEVPDGVGFNNGSTVTKVEEVKDLISSRNDIECLRNNMYASDGVLDNASVEEYNNENEDDATVPCDIDNHIDDTQHNNNSASKVEVMTDESSYCDHNKDFSIIKDVEKVSNNISVNIGYDTSENVPKDIDSLVEAVHCDTPECDSTKDVITEDHFEDTNNDVNVVEHIPCEESHSLSKIEVNTEEVSNDIVGQYCDYKENNEITKVIPVYEDETKEKNESLENIKLADNITAINSEDIKKGDRYNCGLNKTADMMYEESKNEDMTAEQCERKEVLDGDNTDVADVVSTNIDQDNDKTFSIKDCDVNEERSVTKYMKSKVKENIDHSLETNEEIDEINVSKTFQSTDNIFDKIFHGDKNITGINSETDVKHNKSKKRSHNPPERIIESKRIKIDKVDDKVYSKSSNSIEVIENNDIVKSLIENSLTTLNTDEGNVDKTASETRKSNEVKRIDKKKSKTKKSTRVESEGESNDPRSKNNRQSNNSKSSSYTLSSNDEVLNQNNIADVNKKKIDFNYRYTSNNAEIKNEDQELISHECCRENDTLVKDLDAGELSTKNIDTCHSKDVVQETKQLEKDDDFANSLLKMDTKEINLNHTEYYSSKLKKNNSYQETLNSTNLKRKSKLSKDMTENGDDISFVQSGKKIKPRVIDSETEDSLEKNIIENSDMIVSENIGEDCRNKDEIIPHLSDDLPPILEKQRISSGTSKGSRSSKHLKWWHTKRVLIEWNCDGKFKGVQQTVTGRLFDEEPVVGIESLVKWSKPVSQRKYPAIVIGIM